MRVTKSMKNALRGEALALGVLTKVLDDEGRPYKHIGQVPLERLTDFVNAARAEEARIEAERQAVLASQEAAAWASLEAQRLEFMQTADAADKALAEHDATTAQANALPPAPPDKFPRAKMQGTLGDALAAVGVRSSDFGRGGYKGLGKGVVRYRGRFGPGVGRTVGKAQVPPPAK